MGRVPPGVLFSDLPLVSGRLPLSLFRKLLSLGDHESLRLEAAAAPGRDDRGLGV